MNPEFYHSYPVYVFLILFGMAIGSFLNVVIYRLPYKKSIIKPRSECPKCGKTIPFYYNIPIISYMILGGKCKYCKASISIRYLLVEVLTTLIIVGYYAWLGPAWLTLSLIFLTIALLAIFLIDLKHYIIPDVITIPGIIIGLVLSFFAKSPGLVNSLIGIAVGGGGLFLIALLGDLIFKKESMGGGDIKLAAMLGAFLGWQKVLFIFIGSSVIGLIASIFAIIFSSSVRETRRIPFGPFLAIAAVISIIWGEYLINLYIHRFL